MGTSSTKAKNKWNAANYDRIVVSVPKGSKDKIKSKAAAAGKSKPPERRENDTIY